MKYLRIPHQEINQVLVQNEPRRYSISKGGLHIGVKCGEESNPNRQVYGVLETESRSRERESEARLIGGGMTTPMR